MYSYSNKVIWIPLLLVALYVFVHKQKPYEALLIVVCMVLVGVLCDQISSTFIKPVFERLRPTHHQDFKDFVHTVHNYRGGRWGFVSSHAANGLGITVFSSLVLRYKWYTLLSVAWVLVTSYSRIYLGVHFVTDIVGGLILGALSGLSVYFFYQTMRKYVLKVPRQELKIPIVDKPKIHLLMATILGTVLFIIIMSLIES